MVHPLNLIPKHRLDFSNFRSLDNELKARGEDGLVARLYARGSEGTVNRKIGSFEYDSALGAPTTIGAIRLDRVTDSQYGVVASGSGSTRTMESGHNLALSGLGTAWDTSAGAHLATAVAWTRVDDVVTFTAGDPSATFGAGDILYTEGLCEFGETRSIAGGGIWVPKDMIGVWASGLRSISTPDAGFLRFRPGLATALGTPNMLLARATVDCGTMVKDDDAYWSFGSHSPSNDEVLTVGLGASGANWKRTWRYGPTASPSVLTNRNTGELTGQTGIECSVYTVRANSPDEIAIIGNVTGPSMTRNRPVIASGGLTDRIFGQGIDGPPSELGILCSGGTAGSVDVTIKRFDWRAS